MKIKMVLLKRRYILCISILVISKECHNFAKKHANNAINKKIYNVIKNNFILDHMYLQIKIGTGHEWYVKKII